MRKYLHLFLVLSLQILIGEFTGDYLAGCLIGVSFFAGREVRQAQELYLQQTGEIIDGENLYLLVSPKAWTWDSFFYDLVLPAGASVLLFFALGLK